MRGKAGEESCRGNSKDGLVEHGGGARGRVEIGKAVWVGGQ